MKLFIITLLLSSLYSYGRIDPNTQKCQSFFVAQEIYEKGFSFDLTQLNTKLNLCRTKSLSQVCSSSPSEFCNKNLAKYGNVAPRESKRKNNYLASFILDYKGIVAKNDFGKMIKSHNPNCLKALEQHLLFKVARGLVSPAVKFLKKGKGLSSSQVSRLANTYKKLINDSLAKFNQCKDNKTAKSSKSIFRSCSHSKGLLSKSSEISQLCDGVKSNSLGRQFTKYESSNIEQCTKRALPSLIVSSLLKKRVSNLEQKVLDLCAGDDNDINSLCKKNPSFIGCKLKVISIENPREQIIQSISKIVKNKSFHISKKLALSKDTSRFKMTQKKKTLSLNKCLYEAKVHLYLDLVAEVEKELTRLNDSIMSKINKSSKKFGSHRVFHSSMESKIIQIASSQVKVCDDKTTESLKAVKAQYCSLVLKSYKGLPKVRAYCHQ